MCRISYDLIYLMFFIVDRKITTAINSCAKHLSKALRMKDIPYELNENGAKKNSREWLQIALEDMDAVYRFTWDTEKARERQREELEKVLESWEIQYDSKLKVQKRLSRMISSDSNENEKDSSSSENDQNWNNTPPSDINVNEGNLPKNDDGRNNTNAPSDDINVNEGNMPKDDDGRKNTNAPSDDINVNEGNTPKDDDGKNNTNAPSDDINVNVGNTPKDTAPSDEINVNEGNMLKDDDGRKNTNAPSDDINVNEGNKDDDSTNKSGRKVVSLSINNNQDSDVEPTRKRQKIDEVKHFVMFRDLRVIGVEVDLEDVLHKRAGYVVPCWFKFSQGYWPGLAYASVNKIKSYSVFSSRKIVPKPAKNIVPFSTPIL
jgi:hypothetical protein